MTHRGQEAFSPNARGGGVQPAPGAHHQMHRRRAAAAAATVAAAGADAGTGSTLWARPSLLCGALMRVSMIRLGSI